MNKSGTWILSSAGSTNHLGHLPFHTSAGGLGPSAGKVWRVGIMGYNARPANIELVLAAFRDGLKKQGWKKL